MSKRKILQLSRHIRSVIKHAIANPEAGSAMLNHAKKNAMNALGIILGKTYQRQAKNWSGEDKKFYQDISEAILTASVHLGEIKEKSPKYFRKLRKTESFDLFVQKTPDTFASYVVESVIHDPDGSTPLSCKDALLKLGSRVKQLAEAQAAYYACLAGTIIFGPDEDEGPFAPPQVQPCKDEEGAMKRAQADAEAAARDVNRVCGGNLIPV